MLVTDRLILRPWREEDCEPFAAMNADADVMRYFPSVQTRAQSDATIDRQMKAQAEVGYCFWATEKRDSGQFIGFIGIQDVPDYYGIGEGIEIGWRLAANAWGQGLAPEGARACLAFAFSKLQAPEVVAFTAKVNGPSMRVMEKIGMTRDLNGDFDHPMIEAGHPIRPHVLYRIKAEGTAIMPRH